MNKEKIFKEINKNKNWYNKSYSGYFLGIHEQALAISHEASMNEFMLPIIILFQNFSQKDHFDTFWNYNQMCQRRNKIIRRVVEDKKFLPSVMKEWKPLYSKFVRVCDQVSNLNLKKLSKEELKHNLLILHNALLDTCRWSYTVDILLSTESPDWLTREIQKELGIKATNEVIEVLTYPMHASFVEEANLEILKIAKVLKEKGLKKAKEQAKVFVDNYFWVRTNYKSYKRFTVPDCIKEARAEISKDLDEKIKHLQSKTKSETKLKQATFKKLNVSDRLKDIIKLSELFTYFQDKRKEKVLRMNTLSYELVDEIAKRFKIPAPLHFYLTSKEIFSLFDGIQVSHEIIKDRYENGFLTVHKNDSYVLISPKDYVNLDIKNLFPDNENINEIKGSIAYKGIVKGIVRVCRTTDDIKLFKQGEILVANQTTPEYVPAMKKAMAIITDQGGITCHAAIVSRELKLPAIIGTKIATKVLKDGDYVEVDANTGVVKILKRVI
jgi:phosphoenolpyruvate synthase/pyruvate phosphate dikinase